MRKIPQILKQSVKDFFADKVLRLSAALAYYTVFSLAPMLIIILSIIQIFYGPDAAQGSIYGQIKNFVGADAALQIQETIKSARLSNRGGFATIVGVITLIIGATSVFGEIQDSINYIWQLKAKPRKGFIKMLINRLLSFSMVVCLGFLLLVSLLINSIMDIIIDRLTRFFPDLTVYVVYSFNLILTFAITSFLFGLIFKVLPDARISWKHVRAGAFATAALFMLGKFLIGYYLGHSTMSSSYGAAGSVIVILLWVYYSSTILYFGAEFTRVYAQAMGSRIYPNDYAVWIQQVEVESKQSLQEQASRGSEKDEKA